MGLVETLYGRETPEQREVLDKFPYSFFHPRMSYLRFGSVKRAVSQNNKSHLVNPIRNNFMPGEGDEEVQERFRLAINRGVSSLNVMCSEYLGNDASYFLGSEVQAPLDFLEFHKVMRDVWVGSRDGMHDVSTSQGLKDYELLAKVYDHVRAWGLGYLVSLIDTDPTVINSLRQHPPALKWFDEQFDFRSPQQSGISDLPFVWETNVGVDVYGNEGRPIRSRHKMLNEDGVLRYGPILMKLMIKQNYMDRVYDYTGVEFIVKDGEARDKLVSYFRFLRGVGNLEDFSAPSAVGKRSAHSHAGFDCTKFLFRPPILIEAVAPHKAPAFARFPTEVQVLTLEGHRQRTDDPEIDHRGYKEKQYRQVFPLWYPREIYEPLFQ